MDSMVCKNKTLKIILDLISLNLIQMILAVVIIVLLTSCAPDFSRPPLWIRSLETLPPVEGFSRAGVFTINKKIYVQLCDPDGNQIWMRYNKETHTWRQSRYNTLGCVNGKDSTGPNDS